MMALHVQNAKQAYTQLGQPNVLQNALMAITLKAPNASNVWWKNVLNVHLLALVKRAILDHYCTRMSV